MTVADEIVPNAKKAIAMEGQRDMGILESRSSLRCLSPLFGVFAGLAGSRVRTLGAFSAPIDAACSRKWAATRLRSSALRKPIGRGANGFYYVINPRGAATVR